MSENLQKLVKASVAGLQDVEDTILDMIAAKNIDDAEGASLDNRGKIVGQPREGLEDDLYRRIIRAKILVNKSTGTPERLIAITRAVLGHTDGTVAFIPRYPAQAEIRVEGVAVEADVAGVLIDLLRQAKAGGVRVLHEFSESEPEDTFRLDDGPGLDQGHLATALE